MLLIALFSCKEVPDDADLAARLFDADGTASKARMGLPLSRAPHSGGTISKALHICADKYMSTYRTHPCL